LRIALLHFAAPPVVGGVERVLAQQAELMARAGHDVAVIAARGEAWDDAIRFLRAPLTDSSHPEVIAVKRSLDAGTVTQSFDALRTAVIDQLRPLLDGIDILVAHNVCSLHKNLALTAALFDLHAGAVTRRTILWHHDLAWTTPRYRAELHDGYPWDLLRRPWPGAAQVVVSRLRQRELAQLMGLASDEIRVIPSGVDLAEFFKLEELTSSLLERTRLLDAAPILLLPVRVTPRKNLELALHVLAALRRELPAAVLVVTGPLGAHNPDNAAYFDSLRILRGALDLDGAAHFLAEHAGQYLPAAVVADLYRLADVLLLPSFEEGFGIPLLEAALSRIPVFCSAIEPLTELGQGDVSYFDPHGAPEAIAAEIAARLQVSPTYRNAVRIRAHFTWQQIYDRQIEPLLQAVAVQPVPTAARKETAP
jgi:glycosyltransferase involved in cell wall biosynthesis